MVYDRFVESNFRKESTNKKLDGHPGERFVRGALLGDEMAMAKKPAKKAAKPAAKKAAPKAKKPAKKK